MKIKVAVLGATGYAALELLRILHRHPSVEVVAATSRENTNRLDEIHPSLTGWYSISCENLGPKDLAARGVDAVFSCLPHTATAAVAPELRPSRRKWRHGMVLKSPTMPLRRL